jgi:hypothetical protein
MGQSLASKLGLHPFILSYLIGNTSKIQKKVTKWPFKIMEDWCT